MKRLIDKNFMPMAIVLRDFKNEVAAAPHKTLTVCVEREKGYNYSYKLDIFKDNDEKNYAVAERIVKTLIWLVGGYKVYVAGDSYIAKRLKEDYRKGGAREFDADVLLLYPSGCSPAAVMAKVKKLTSGGESVYAAAEEPENMRFRRIVKL